jgi:1-acyl-sn-glycerol-3-phosphate acyltransferase
MWSLDCRPQVLVKKELFRGPLGWLLVRLGGIPVDRARPTGAVRTLILRARGGEPFQVVLAAEGTRQPVTYWKSGFYRIAQLTGLPISLGFIDGPTRTAGFGPSLVPTGDLVADMDVIRGFYADKRGLRPALRTEPRLREETTDDAARDAAARDAAARDAAAD